ncbi:MAG: polymer-forming cytoskeletal protein [Rhodospirillaceae bacterium]|nr:polymer-forming cytoskeletal protein [Rhodospirillaceae bacterium]
MEAETSHPQDGARSADDRTNDRMETAAAPRLDLSLAAHRADVRPPLKPFGAGQKTNPFFGAATPKFPAQRFSSHTAAPAPAAQQTKGRTMSDRFSSDRMAAFSPQVAKRVADIPNLTIARGDADMDGKRLVIGKQIRMSGEISGCEKLVVEGKVEATLSDVKSIEVTANGTFKGNAEVESAVIAGTYEGSLKVNGHLEIAPSGTVKGGVSYKTIAVANGGKLLGSIESIEG